MQTQHAPSENAYWVAAGNPKTGPKTDTAGQLDLASETPGPALTNIPVLDQALEKNRMALEALRTAVKRQKEGNPKQAIDQVTAALRHVKAQSDILTGNGSEASGQPFKHTHPISHAIASEQNAKASEAIQKSICHPGIQNVPNVPNFPNFPMKDIAAATEILEAQHNVLTNAAKDMPPPATPSPDAEHLLKEIGEDIESALSSMKLGRSWETAGQLETVLQKLDNHRKLKAQAGRSTPEDLPSF